MEDVPETLPVLDLMALCEEDPVLANEILQNGNHRLLHRHALQGVPCVAHVGRPLNSTHVNRVVCITGTVLRVYEVLLRNVQSENVCLRCQEEKSASVCVGCGGTAFRITRDFAKAVPCQRVRIQDVASGGALSEPVEVSITGPDAGRFVPGDTLFVAGVVRRRWRPLRVNEAMASSLFLEAYAAAKVGGEASQAAVQIEAYLALDTASRRRLLLSALAPSLTHTSAAAFSVLISLSSTGKLGGSSRRTVHVMLVGDPGTGKSHLLRAAVRAIAPSVLANGVGTSDAGLTCCAVRTGRSWALTAGALVLADGGVCAIDEFHRLKAGERSGLLEAMEQQHISVAKAGIVASLHTRCAVIASVTHRGYDPSKPVSVSLGLSTPLVTRFDLIIGLFDDRGADPSMADSVMSRGPSSKTGNPEDGWFLLKRFLLHCTKQPGLEIPDDLREPLVRYYTHRRRADGPSEANTVRMLESLVRIACAHARLMAAEAVVLEDIYVAIILMESSVSTPSTMAIDTNRVFVDRVYFGEVQETLRKRYGLEQEP